MRSEAIILLEFGVDLIPDHPVKTAELVKRVEKMGFSSAWILDSHMLWQEAYTCLTLSAAATKKIKLGPGVTNPFTRHPTVTASAIASVNQVSNGRAVLGIGRGDSSVRTIGLKPVTLTELEKSVHLIRTLLAGKEGLYDGHSARIQWCKTSIPIFIAAYGPKALDLAGRVGDGVILQLGSPGVVGWSVKAARSAAKKIGRSPNKMRVMTLTAFYVSNDINKARDAVRWFPPVVSNHVMDLLSRYKPGELPDELVRDMEVFKGKYHYEEHFKEDAAHRVFTSDEMVDRLTVIGKPDDCIKKIEELVKAGTDQLCLYPVGDDLEQQLEIFSRRIIPYFAS